MMGIAFWLGLLWRRATVAGAWASVIAGFAGWWVGTRPSFVAWAAELPMAESLNFVTGTGESAALYEPWLITGYLGAGLISGILVSLVTPRVNSEQLDLYYNLTKTPIHPGEVIDLPCQLPDGVAPNQRPMLVTAFDLEVPQPSVTTVVGFALSWVGVVVLIGGCVLLVTIW
jgi:hypothetical protein